jgi:UDP-3-O-[3-hydroxymyristoyl] N-acetylglucosamine deacetylase/3-hydroxyacyl-[acyl-carrier-protein] dehydratase
LKLQKTIKGEGQVSGKGLFGGQDVQVVFKPAPEDTGVVFVRADLSQPVRIKATVPSITGQDRKTTLGHGSIEINTVEHCLAAVSALEIDNIIIEVTGPEMPASDASAAEYFALLKQIGLTDLGSPIRSFIITEPISVVQGDASIYALPGARDKLEISYDLDYPQEPAIGRQIYGCELTPDTFEENLAAARTFLMESEAKALQSQGIGTHIEARDLLVINEDGPINNQYRFPNEPVRHKMVDLIGDLSLAGRRIYGRMVARKSGHALNQAMAKKIFDAALRLDRIDQFGTDAILDIRRIQKILPHRYPFLLVDKITQIDGDTRIVGIKNVTFNELFFQGHFPGTPIMPGVLIVEAMAQVSGLLFAQRLEHTGKLAVLLSMDGVKLRKAVVPGDQLVLSSETIRLRRRTAHCKCTAHVDGVIAAEAEIKFMLIDDEKV